MQIGEVRKAQVRSINPRHKVLNLFSGSTKEGFSTQVYELGQDAAIIVNGVPGQLESIRSGNNQISGYIPKTAPPLLGLKPIQNSHAWTSNLQPPDKSSLEMAQSQSCPTLRKT